MFCFNATRARKAAATLAFGFSSLAASSAFAENAFEGGYVGFNLNYTMSDVALNHIGEFPAASVAFDDVAGTPSGDFDFSGVAVGAHAGYMVQQDNLVFGVEARYLNGGPDVSFNTTVGAADDTISFEADNFWDVSLKAGMAEGDRLLYGKVGYTELEIDSSWVDTGGPIVGEASGSTTLDGLLLGIGIEQKMSESTSFALEYNYVDFGSARADLLVTSDSNGVVPNERLVNEYDFDPLHRISAGVSFHF